MILDRVWSILLFSVSRNPDIGRTINRVTWGVTKNLSELLLCQIAFGLAALTTTGGKNSRTAGRIIYNAGEIGEELVKFFDPEQMQSAFQNLRRKGLIESVEGKLYEAKITELGLKKLEEKMPAYKDNRPWDKRIYLVNYDIEEVNKGLRQKLRKYLLSIGCVQLQKSTYLTIFNPRGLLKTWIQDYLQSGEILVSDLGPNGSMGDKPLNEIVIEAYGLNQLNAEYSSFLDNYPPSAKNNSATKTQAIFCYQSILQKDPQLPFELLPDWWFGDKAWRRYRKIISN